MSRTRSLAELQNAVREACLGSAQGAGQINERTLANRELSGQALMAQQGIMQANRFQYVGEPVREEAIDHFGYRFEFAGEDHTVSIDGKLARLLGPIQQVRKVCDIMASEFRALLQRLTRPVTEEELTRALWETDPEVGRFVREKADHVIRFAGGTYGLDVPKHQATLELAWSRQEPAGSVERAQMRAGEVINAINYQRRSPSGGNAGGEKR